MRNTGILDSFRRRLSVLATNNGSPRIGSKSLDKKSVQESNVYQQKRSVFFFMQNAKPPRLTGYYLTLPDEPNETVENNVFLSNIASNQDWPCLTKATPQQMFEGTIRMNMDYGATIHEHVNLLKEDKTMEKNFDNVLLPLLSEQYDCEYAYNTLLMKMVTDWPECPSNALDADIYHMSNFCYTGFSSKLGNPSFQDALQHIYDNQREELDSWKVRLIETYLADVHASPLSARDEKKMRLLSSWMRFCHMYYAKYLINLCLTNDETSVEVPSRNYLKYAPPHALRILAGKNPPDLGPWTGRLAPNSAYTLLKYCNDRPTRRAIWDAWVGLTAFEGDLNLNNSVVIEEIRHNQDGLVKTLGYKSVAEHRLCHQMAGSAQTVRDFVTELTDRIRPVFLDRLQSWSAYAAANEMITGELKPYDLFYICAREGEKHYNVDTLDLMNHFPFWPTFENTIEIVSHLLNLTFCDITDSDLERCDPSVRIWSVTDKSTGEHLGRLYVDPFERHSKRCRDWMVLLGRPENKIRSLDKIVYCIGNACAPDDSGNSLLHHTQLQSMLFSFGRAVQFLMSRSPYRDLAIPVLGRISSSFDAADLFPTFMQFFLNKPNLLLALSSPHKVTGESLAKQADATALALSRSMLWETYRTLFWTDFDLSIYEMENRKDKFWRTLYIEMYQAYFPFKREKFNHQPCSFTPIFTNAPLMGTYYRKLWAEMLALDVHDTFFRESDERSTGERLKTAILNVGDGEPQGVLYNKFQGRDPSIGAICDFYDPPASSEVTNQEQFATAM